MNTLLKHIYDRLRKEDWPVLPSSLKDGKIGLMLFFALYSEHTGNSRSRKLSATILSDLVSDTGRQDLGLLSGKLGMPWSLNLLIQEGILEKDELLDRYLSATVNECAYPLYFIPIQVTDDRVFDWGLYMLRKHTENDSLERYATDERLINLTDGCERLLTSPVKYIHDPEKMPLSMLHSLLFFLQNMKEKKIYPYKAGLLIEKVKEKHARMEKQPLCDEYIYRSLSGEAILPEGLTDSELFRFMGEIGFYSLLYGKRNMFLSALEQLDEAYPDFLRRIHSIIKDAAVTTGQLCGWGYGLLSCKTNGND